MAHWSAPTRSRHASSAAVPRSVPSLLRRSRSTRQSAPWRIAAMSCLRVQRLQLEGGVERLPVRLRSGRVVERTTVTPPPATTHTQHALSGSRSTTGAWENLRKSTGYVSGPRSPKSSRMRVMVRGPASSAKNGDPGPPPGLLIPPPPALGPPPPQLSHRPATDALGVVQSALRPASPPPGVRAQMAKPRGPCPQ